MRYLDWPCRIYRFYRDGFRSMTLGRTLWMVIFIKLIIMFGILRIFFFPDLLGGLDNDQQRGECVREHFLEVRP